MRISDWSSDVCSSDLLRKQGNSKEKSARISNAAAARGKSAVGKKGGKSGSYEDWTVTDLKKRAKELGISGYAGLTKSKQIGRASCRERVCQDGLIQEVAGSLKKKG